jgi:hypothetical protein
MKKLLSKKQIENLKKHAEKCKNKPAFNRMDITNKRFGKLVAKNFIGKDKFGLSLWNCVCDCGNERIVTLNRLRHKKDKIISCKKCNSITRRKYNLLNKKFGKLLVIELIYDENKKIHLWKCKCDCGNFKNIPSYNLTHGCATSCGCMKKQRGKNTLKPMIGIKFGKLTPIEISGKEKNGQYIYNCICDCGKTFIARGRILRSGGIKSCGCSRMLEKGQAAFNRLLRTYKYCAKNRNLNFSLSDNEFENLINKNCYYCDTPPTQNSKGRNYNGTYFYNGIDRVDNCKGYCLENCVTCCKYCNYSKTDRNIEDFKEWIKKCYDKLFTQN